MIREKDNNLVLESRDNVVRVLAVAMEVFSQLHNMQPRKPALTNQTPLHPLQKITMKMENNGFTNTNLLALESL